MSVTVRVSGAALRPGYEATIVAESAGEAIGIVEQIVAAYGADVPTPSELDTVPAIPDKIIAYAKSWGQDWAEESTLDRARKLWLESKNWEVVFQELLKQDGEK